jgi:lipopolysaccharide biosynthesis regulator YciM
MTQHKLPELMAEPHWHSYLHLSLGSDEDSEEVDQSEAGKDRLRQQLLALQNAVRANPNHARSQLLMASGFLRLFRMKQEASENPMTLSQIRDAALASNFQSLAAQDEWLTVAVGDNLKFLRAALTHTRQSLRLCPMQGRGYLQLAELSFLESLDQELPQRYIDQAVVLRPYDPRVLFIAGREAWTKGEFQSGVEHWRKAFQRSYAYQEFIMQMLAPNVPAQYFVETFAPDRDALVRMIKQFRSLNKAEDFKYLVSRYAQSSVELAKQSNGGEALTAWLDAQRAFDDLNDPERAQACLQNALKVDPTSYEAHHAAGKWFYQHQQFAAAAEHLSWCAERRPRDQELQALAAEASKQRLTGASGIRTVSGDDSDMSGTASRN